MKIEIDPKRIEASFDGDPGGLSMFHIPYMGISCGRVWRQSPVANINETISDRGIVSMVMVIDNGELDRMSALERLAFNAANSV